MSKYDFDTVINRKNTNSLKYDFAEKRNYPKDVLPYWVADMDFKTPKEVTDALINRINHGIFGYTYYKDDYLDVVKKWFYNHYDYKIENDWIVTTPGVVFAIVTAINAFTEEGDAVIIQQPVYYPFRTSIVNNNRKLVVNSLVYKDNKYSIDFDDFEEKIILNKVKLFILCNPQNPVGRVWTKEELTKLGEICLRHNVIVVSDEIHCDFVYEGYKHTPFASINEEFEDITITCTSPSKTFNLAGLQISNIFIKNSSLRRRFKFQRNLTGYDEPNTLGLTACYAAYSYGDPWLKELKAYLLENIRKTNEFLNEHLNKVKLIKTEGTYLIWLDFSAYNLSDDELNNIIINKANLWLDKGSMFGPEGEQFQRINVACPWIILEKALNNLKEAFKEYI
ncbi:MAG: pyridoxal phosphate-dependent aminotransferase [Clostridiales bacterium]|nr:pyridoxal phosphate-dependent aminotransferase [Clostridiales bacterium]